MRIGHGYDVHAFETDAEQAPPQTGIPATGVPASGIPVSGIPPSDAAASIVIGGVHIPARSRLLAHSDGDVLIHAICDALLGAAGLGDIGRHFPDTDPAYKNADSRQLLRTVVARLRDIGFSIGNIDSTIVAQAPRMAEHISQMQRNIAEDCEVSPSSVNVKATTTEKLGFVGRQEGIACHAVALIESLA